MALIRTKIGEVDEAELRITEGSEDRPDLIAHWKEYHLRHARGETAAGELVRRDLNVELKAGALADGIAEMLAGR